MEQLQIEKVIFLCCDIQDVFNNEANRENYNTQQIIDCACFMNNCAALFNIPIIVSEQNPKTFGKTVNQVQQSFSKETHKFEKLEFSMLNIEGNQILKKYKNRNQVIIYGLETHICIQQTCLDLINNGYQVHVLTDGTSSSKPIYRTTAYEFLKQSGILLNTSQSVIYQLMKTSNHEKFKDVLKLIKQYKFTNIFPKL